MADTNVIVGAFIAIVIFAGNPAGALGDEGLAGEWHFDGDAKDTSGNGNDGMIYGATFVDGKFGKALSFDGVDDYINIGTIPNLNALTIEAWVFIDPTINIGQRRIISKDNYRQPGIRKNYALTTSSSLVSGKNGHAAFGVGVPIGGVPIEVENCDIVESPSPLTSGWHHLVGIRDTVAERLELYVDGMLVASKKPTNLGPIDSAIPTVIGQVSPYVNEEIYKGLIDEVRIYNRALSAEEIKSHYEQGSTALTVKKEVSPYSIRQYQTTNVTVQIKNTGTSEIRDIEVADSTNSNLELISGDFPNPKKYNSLSPGESRDIRYILKSKESGTFILNPATVSYADNTGNIKVVKSEPVSLIVVTSSESPPDIYPPSYIGSSSAVLLHGEKTDVVLGEDILLKLSAVNLITKPPMTVQVMIYPPSGMSVTGSEFVKSGAGIYTTTYTLNPGDGRDIEVHIKSNQVGDFNVKGRIVYYFGEEKPKAEDQTLNLPIKVRKEPGPPESFDPTPKAPGFAGELAIIGILFVTLLIKRYRANGTLL